MSIRLTWSGGFESSYVITRAVMQCRQLETYEQLLDRVLQLTLAGKRSPEVASILEQEGFRSFAAPQYADFFDDGEEAIS